MILHLVDPGEAGGRERVVQALALSQQKMGYEVCVATILAADVNARSFVHPFQDSGVSVTEIRLPARSYLRERAAIAELCKSVRPSVVHTHGYRPDVVDGSVALGLGIHAVTTVHGFTSGGLRNRFYEWLQLKALRHFNAVVAVSRALKDRLAASGLDHRRIHVIKNGWYEIAQPLDRLDARRQLNVTNGCFHIGWVGRISREKGLDVLIRALPMLQGLCVKVSIIGDGPERVQLQNLANEIGVASCINWHGVIADASRFFPAFDVLTLTSRAEGTPIVLFEAMAANVPIIATEVGGVPDVVGAGEGLIVQPEDSRAFAEAIRSTYDDKPRAASRAVTARNTLERKFSVEAWLAAYEDVYRRVRGEDQSGACS